MNLKKSLLLVSVILLIQGCSDPKTVSLVSIPLDFGLRIKCTYRHGTQIAEPVRFDHSWFEVIFSRVDELEKIKKDYTKVSLKIVENSSDMDWDFFDLTTDIAVFD